MKKCECTPDFAADARVVSLFAEQMKLSLDDALEFFYHSDVSALMREGVSDMHCMSDAYLAEELQMEYEEKKHENRSSSK